MGFVDDERQMTMTGVRFCEGDLMVGKESRVCAGIGLSRTETGSAVVLRDVHYVELTILGLEDEDFLRRNGLPSEAVC